jgi:hypothetical protein
MKDHAFELLELLRMKLIFLYKSNSYIKTDFIKIQLNQ